MTTIHDVRLELVRPGKPHNQLLSPLTPYMALCGEGSPVTFYIDFEHQQLLTRLERLRYETVDEGTMVPLPNSLREAELADLGEEVARMLAEICTLSTALARAQGNGSGRAAANDALVHLRLILSGSELSLLPFELAISPQGYPGEGLELSLQSSLPIVVTREIHRDRPATLSWNTDETPKILFVYAEPEGMSVPAQEHINALRAAIEPWTKRILPEDGVSDEDRDRQRLQFVKQRLRILPNAGIEKIYAACAAERFTHVHILAHGAGYKEAGVQRFGVALCKGGSPMEMEIVSGKRLAKALQAEDAKGMARSTPLVVSLATCDSGNQSEVLVPGGSIAHDLHSEGIPWVFASQFPLTIPGSVRLTRKLYPRLLRGDDPRQALFEVRRQLFLEADNDHDWASVVAYATPSSDLETEVSDFCSKQIKRAIEVSLDYADKCLRSTEGQSDASPALKAESESAAHEVEELLRIWWSRLPPDTSAENRARRAEIFGMHGSTLKRIALLRERLKNSAEKIGGAYDESLGYYEQAMKEAASLSDKFYWTATQYLSLRAVRNGARDPDNLELAKRLAERDARSTDPSVAAWAHGTLAELEMLTLFHGPRPSKRNEEREVARIRANVVDHCEKVRELMGKDSFHVGSTWRQFKRYLDFWKDKKWEAIAKAAVCALSPPHGAAPPSKFPDE